MTEKMENISTEAGIDEKYRILEQKEGQMVEARYFVGFGSLEKGKEYLEDNGFVPVSVSVVKVEMPSGDVSSVPAIVAGRQESEDDPNISTYLIFGNQWTSGENENEHGMEFVLLEDIDFNELYNHESEEDCPIKVPRDGFKKMVWVKK